MTLLLVAILLTLRHAWWVAAVALAVLMGGDFLYTVWHLLRRPVQRGLALGPPCLPVAAVRVMLLNGGR